MPWTFSEPGGVADFDVPESWHAVMASLSRAIVRSLVADVLDKPERQVTQSEIDSEAPRLGYVNPTSEEPPIEAATVNIPAWGGFPRAVERRDWSDITAANPDPDDPDGRYRAVEQLGEEDHRAGVFVNRINEVMHLPVRHRQDEYLEWRVSADGRAITFVSEGYDFFAELFRHSERRVVDLYREFTGNDRITADDLRAREGVWRVDNAGRRSLVSAPGDFNPRNMHNISEGIVHLSHRANSLGAEVFLAGTSAMARKKADGTTLDGNDAEELMCCNRGGAPNRNSDPIISQAGYREVLKGKRYTLADPVGLYIADVEFGGVLLPDNSTPVPREWWHAIRGDGLGDIKKSRVLRLELRIPESERFEGRPLLLTDLFVGGARLRFPGQIAELVKVHLFVTLWDRTGGGIGPVLPCLGTCCVSPGSALLRPTTTGCRPPATDRFPGLIGPQALPQVARRRAVPMRDDDIETDQS